MFTFDIRLHWCETSISSWHIWIDDRPKLIVLHLFQLSTRLNSQKTYENEIHNEIWHINLYMNTGISNCNIWIIDSTKMRFLNYFVSIHDYLPSITRNSIVHYSWSEMELCEKRAFQLLKMRKINISWNIKIKYVTDIFMIVRSSSMKDCTCFRGWEQKKQTFT